ncbi:DUF5810 domain-containing protein [Halococcus agarilyticus]|uniref:DUF5810 domain-containing protein n=1 Tax=Halococcus agarilyticus TaxID=1232219 RepID=UPI0006779D02|nr:DUF5810 domain-containing protein [Halococcus agarilyticus]
MGYACPVCETPQADARHLANHLAFTALLGDDDHEAWLDEHAPDWADAGEDDLADRVTEYAESAEFPQVFEDTTGHDHRAGDNPRPGELFEEGSAEEELSRTRGPGAHGGAELDAETAAAVEEAREMARRANGDDAADGDDTTEDDATDGSDTVGDADGAGDGDDTADGDENG